MNKNATPSTEWYMGFSATIIFLTIAILVVVGYFGYKSIYKSQKSPLSSTSSVSNGLIGIWQANGGMAAGWSDRYHFYDDGNFHFYPDQMTCKNLETEKIGTWQLSNNNLILTTTHEVLDTNKCLSEGKTLLSSKNVVLGKPIIENFSYQYLGVEGNDNYPSIKLSGVQFWKFSDDPSSYGDEKFVEL